MATKPRNKHDNETIEIVELKQGRIEVFVLGVTPIVQNRMAVKAQRTLLLPDVPKNKAERAQSLKHDPLNEYRDSIYRIRSTESPTLIGMPAQAFKGAMRTAALHVPGVARAEVNRLIWVEGDLVPIYGIPSLRMDVVRMADISRTPDLRTRATLAEWCCKLTINHTLPTISVKSAANLLAGGGMICGVGDNRQEKGSGNCGLFELVGADDPRWQRIAERGGRTAQIAAMHEPAFFDDDSEQLFDWYEQQITQRERRADVARGREEAASQYAEQGGN